MGHERLQNKSASILVVEGNSSLRQAMVGVLKDLGFEHSNGVPAIDDAFLMLGNEGIDWLITPAVGEGRVNGFQLLELAARHKDLERTLLSFVVTDADDRWLGDAFGRGLFTAIRRPSARQDFERSVQAVLERLEECKFDPLLTAAQEAREQLERLEKLTALVAFERALTKLYPEDARQLLRYAEAAFKADDQKTGRNVAWQATQLDPELAEAARELSQRHTEDNAEVGNAGAIAPGVVFVIDPDSAVQKAARDALNAAGAKDVQVFDNGLAAWERVVAKGAPNLVITEWRLAKLSGATFLQRLRAAGHHQTAVMVQSSLLDAKDEYLVREMGVDSYVKKPMRTQDFLNCLSWTVSQDRRPTDVKAMETKVPRLLASGELAEAARVFDAYKKTQPTNPRRLFLEALFAYHTGDGARAKRELLGAIAGGGPSIERLNLLGKVHLLLRETEQALKVFEKAQGISPQCIERLCTIAEANAELGRRNEADTALAAATEADSQNQAVINSNVKVGLMTGDKERVARYLTQVRPEDSVISYLNNQAVAFARTGDLVKSLAIYSKALAALPDNDTSLRPVVTYNFALCFARHGDAKKALAQLSALKLPSDLALARKVKALEARATSAVQSGEPMTLNLEEQTTGGGADEAPDAKSEAGKPVAKPAAAGPRFSRCLRNLLPLDAVRDAAVDTMIASLPRFAFRANARK